jgi:hypothetical protein
VAAGFLGCGDMDKRALGAGRLFGTVPSMAHWFRLKVGDGRHAKRAIPSNPMGCFALLTSHQPERLTTP